MGRAADGERGRHPPAPRSELRDRQIPVHDGPIGTVRHHRRAQDRHPGVDRRAAIRKRDPRRRPLGEREPALGLCGAAGQRPEPPSHHGERGVAPQLVLAEPAQPPVQGLQPAVVVGRQGELVDEAGDRVGLARGVAVHQSGFGQVVGDAPLHRPAVELGGHVWLTVRQLVAQQLGEQVVVAIPLRSSVEGDDELVRALEPLEYARGPRRLDHRVAEVTAHPIQHRGLLEEPSLGVGKPGHQLDAEVIGHEAVVTGEDPCARRAWRARLHREGRQIQAGGPALGALRQLIDLILAELDSRRAEQQRGFPRVEPELLRTDLVQPPVSAPATERQRRLLSARDRDRRTLRDRLEQLGEHVMARGIGDRVQIIEREHERLLAGGQGVAEPDHAFRPAGSAPARQRIEHLRRQRLDSVHCAGDIAQQDHGIVVSAVERDPGERARIGLRPPREEGRFAVSGRRDHGHERGPRSAQVGDHVCLRDRPGPGRRWTQLHLGKVERSSPSCHRAQAYPCTMD